MHRLFGLVNMRTIACLWLIDCKFLSLWHVMVIAVWELTAAVMVNFAQTYYIVNKNLC